MGSSAAGTEEVAIGSARSDACDPIGITIITTNPIRAVMASSTRPQNPQSQQVGGRNLGGLC